MVWVLPGIHWKLQGVVELTPSTETDKPAGKLANATMLITVKLTGLLASPPIVTTTLPVAAPLGTAATMVVGLQLAAIPAFVPLKVTVLLPWDAPKLLPVIVTDVPTGPEVTDRLVILGGLGGAITVKLTGLLACPPTVTTTLPVVAPLGTVITIVFPVQFAAIPAFVPLNVTVLAP